MTEQPILITSVLAKVDIPKHRFVTADGYIGTDEFTPLGVSNADTLAGEMCPVICSGIALVYSGAAIGDVGIVVNSDFDGKAVFDTSPNTSVGINLALCSGANELVPILLR